MAAPLLTATGFRTGHIREVLGQGPWEKGLLTSPTHKPRSVSVDAKTGTLVMRILANSTVHNTT